MVSNIRMFLWTDYHVYDFKNKNASKKIRKLQDQLPITNNIELKLIENIDIGMVWYLFSA